MASSPEFEYSPDELNELLSAVMPDIPGYRVMRLLGRGGMSFVYLGVQESLDRQVAIKVIRPDALKDEISRIRFEKEAHTIAKLQHPCIVGIHEVGSTEQGLFFYVMPYLAKGHLGDRKITGDEPRIIAVLHALLWALDYAHLRGMVHRDVKAENVLFDNADRPVLTDFGIALNRMERSRITGSGFAIGSGEYMAPEQARGESVDGRADLYSLGVLTFEQLTGELPFKHAEPLSLALMHAMDPIPRLPAKLQHWQGFIDKAMAKSREERFADAQEMMSALEQVEADCARAVRAAFAPAPQTANPQGLRAALATIPARWRKPAAAAFITIVLIAATVVMWPSRPDRNAANPALTEFAAPVQTAAPPSHVDAAPAEASMAASPEADGQVDESSVGGVLASIVEETALLSDVPGERELAVARGQIAQRRLTQPPGDNALQSLLDAHRLAPDTAGLAEAGGSWMRAAMPYLADALNEGRPDAANALFSGAVALADALKLRSGEDWRAVQRIAAAPFKARLQSSLAANDLDRLRAVKSEVEAMGIETGILEPLWSKTVIVAHRGDSIRGGTSLVLASIPNAGQPGLAVMPRAVTRDEYAAFARATGRPAASCRIRTAMMTLKRRSWESPAFDQGGNHPVVCVSVADATAYAAWLGERDGFAYRLPRPGEWQSVANYPGFETACKAGQVPCAGKGTSPAASGPISAPGVHAMQGNVREWPADCGPGCREHATLGFSWRDAPSDRKTGDERVDAKLGYDDLGFRLVRDVARKELEQR